VSNPVFNNSAIFGNTGGRGTVVRGARPARAPYDVQDTVPGVTTQGLEDIYGAPAATTRDTARLTYDDVIVKTGGLLALLVVVAAATWFVEPRIWPIGMVVGLVLGLVNAFKKEPSPALIVAYTIAQGVFLGGVSVYFQAMTYDGNQVQPIVLQAVLGTFATFGAALFLFRSGRVRVTPKFTRWLMISMVGYVAFSLLNFVLSFFMPSEGFGPLRNGWVGIAVGLFAVGLAAASLIMDFDSIKRGVEGGVAAKFAWTAAFGLIVTLVWLYLEILRLLAIFNRR
jgi:uncharacterized YccA/Bax inhibitor family protein